MSRFPSPGKVVLGTLGPRVRSFRHRAHPVRIFSRENVGSGSALPGTVVVVETAKLSRRLSCAGDQRRRVSSDSVHSQAGRYARCVAEVSSGHPRCSSESRSAWRKTSVLYLSSHVTNDVVSVLKFVLRFAQWRNTLMCPVSYLSASCALGPHLQPRRCWIRFHSVS